MKIKYFPDTDTALFEFTDKEVYETKEISENIYVDLDKKGNLVIEVLAFSLAVKSFPICNSRPSSS